MSIIAPLLWSFLPSQLTSTLIPYLSTYLPGLFPPSPKGSPGYERNYRWAYTLLVSGYLAWSFASSGSGAGEDWYALLAVNRDVDEDGLKKAYRALSRIHHPDRSPSSGDYFILVRQAYECLSDPVKRYAYDRFGPDITSWRAASYREYTRQGLTQSVGFYIVSLGLMLVLNFLGRAQEGSYWRNVLFASLFVAELGLVTTPSIPHAISFLPITQPAFLQVRFLHRVFTSLSIGIAQLGGVWASKQPTEGQVINEMVKAVNNIEVEAVGGFQEAVVSLLSRGNAVQAEALLLRGMEQALVDRVLATHPQIRPLWLEATSKTDDRKYTHSHHTKPHTGEVYPRLPRAPMMGWQDQGGLSQAAGVPLPPSPPPSPVLRPIHL